MGEGITYCVRGCVTPCVCTECLIADKPVHAPLQSQTDLGLLCEKCVKNLRRMLREIPDLYATLDVTPAAAGPGEGLRHVRVSGSPALARLDVVALMDPRTAATDSSGEAWDGSAYIPNEVGTWALLLAEERGVATRIATMYEAARFLTDWIAELCASEWVDECYDALVDAEKLLKRAHGDVRVKPLGKCINVYERDGEMVACNGTLYAPDWGVEFRCRTCGRRYDGNAMLLARMQAKRDQESA